MADCPIVVLDACVLYPAGLRSLMMWLAVHGLIRPKWSEQIHEEWMRNVLKDRPDLTRTQLERTRRLMDEHGSDCLVTGHEQHIASLTLPDMDDRHVVAAGIEAGRMLSSLGIWETFQPRWSKAVALRFGRPISSSVRCLTPVQLRFWLQCGSIARV